MLYTAFACLVVAASAALPSPSAQDWVAWKLAHHKVYTSAEAEMAALEKYTANAKIVAEASAAESAIDWQLELNQFADMSAEEFAGFYNGYKANGHVRSSTRLHRLSGATPPTSVDWREKGLVAPVKNQGSCGSCWAFSTVVSIEGQQAKRNGKVVSLSEQNLVDCVKNEKLPNETDTCCNGCQGGLMDFAFEYLVDKQAGLIDTEASYGYKGVNGKCHYEKADAGVGQISNHVDVKAGDEDALLDAVATVGPISVGVDAAIGWQLYHGGILKPLLCSSNPKKMDHGVAVVGYGTENGVDYWIIRNSWGASWGEKGYMRLIRGKNACGVANGASYPVLA